MRIILPVILFLVTAAPAFAQADFPKLEKIRKIKVLESTRDEVRKLLGDEDDLADEDFTATFFAFDDLSVRIRYAEGDCADDDIWNVVKDKVTQIDIYFKGSKKTKALKSLWSKLEKIVEDEDYEPDEGEEIDYIYIGRATGASYAVTGDLLDGIKYMPTEDRYLLLCKTQELQESASVKEWFLGEYRHRWNETVHFKPFANVDEVTLGREDIFLGCRESDEQNCPDESRITVITLANTNFPNDVITYNYNVSGGKIMGSGARVIWDLAGVKPGTYTITAGADNGCGVCGTTQTKEVIVRECPTCGPNPN